MVDCHCAVQTLSCKKKEKAVASSFNHHIKNIKKEKDNTALDVFI